MFKFTHNWYHLIAFFYLSLAEALPLMIYNNSTRYILGPMSFISMRHSYRFNEFASLGIQALEDIHMRAQYELFGDVLLMTNGIKNSLKVNPSGK